MACNSHNNYNTAGFRVVSEPKIEYRILAADIMMAPCIHLFCMLYRREYVLDRSEQNVHADACRM